MAEKLSSGINLYDYMTDTNQEIYEGTFGKTDGTNPSSMEVINEFMENKITLNGEVNSKQNFNFIGNKVVQDGLVESVVIPKSTSKSISTTQIFTYIFDFVPTKTGWFLLGDTWGITINLADKKIKIQNINDNSIVYATNLTVSLNEKATIVIRKDSSSIKIAYNGMWETVAISLTVPTTLKLRNTDGWDEIKFISYTNALSQKEITHNISVINNYESINSLNIGDKKLLLSSDSNHVEMATGRTLEEDYTALLKQHAKEFTSTGSAITVNNGIKGKVISGEIKGNTIKNLIANTISVGVDWISDNNFKFTYKYSTSSTVTRRISFNATLEVGKEYTLVFNVLKNTLTGTGANSIIITSTPNVGYATFLPTSSVGKFKRKITPTSVNGEYSFAINTQELNGGELIVQGFAILEGDYTNVDVGDLSFGLNSTKAILNNNGSLFPIYEPTIVGKTRIVDTDTGLVPTDPLLPPLKDGDVLDLATRTITFANKTTRVLTEEEVKAYSKHKKVILTGKVDNVVDTVQQLEDGSGIWTQNTKEIVLNGSENWALNVTYTNTQRFIIAIQDKLNASAFITNNFKYGDLSTEDIEQTIRVADNRVVIQVLKTKASTVEQFKAWLQSNPITIRYQLATPIVTHIPKELMPTIATVDKINILNVESPVAPSEFKVSVPVDRIGELEARLQAIENVAYTPTNMSLSTNYIDDEYNKNLQTESEMI